MQYRVYNTLAHRDHRLGLVSDCLHDLVPIHLLTLKQPQDEQLRHTIHKVRIGFASRHLENHYTLNSKVYQAMASTDVQNPFKPGTYYKAGTSILNSPDAGPIAKQILSFFGKLPPQCQIASGTAGINAFAGVDTNDCSTKRPDTDNADKGDFRFNYQQSEMASLRRV